MLAVVNRTAGRASSVVARLPDRKESPDCAAIRKRETFSLEQTAVGRAEPAAYDGIIVGASVIRGRHQRSVRDFVRAHCASLNAMPTAFFSVSGSAASPDERGGAEARRCVEIFLGETHWRPAITDTIAGAMAYTKYGPLLRWILKQIAKRNGGPTDTSREHEMTDWQQVQHFVERFAAAVDRASRSEVATGERA